MTSARIPVRVHTSAPVNELVGLRDGVLLVRVTAPPVDGRANDSLCRLIAKRLRVRTSAVSVVRGHRFRDKLVQIDGVDQSVLLDALAK